MCKCSERTLVPAAPVGESLPGDVQVEVLYPPRTEIGRVTRRFYPRAGYGDTLWVDPRDVEAGVSAGLWRLSNRRDTEVSEVEERRH